MIPEKTISIDFEFNQSSEKFVNLVSVAWQIHGEDETPSVWLRDEGMEKARVAALFRNLLIVKGYALLCFSAPAELRSLRSLGFTEAELYKIKVIDLYIEWRQLTYNNDFLSYGTYFKNGKRKVSVPPSFNADLNKFKDNNPMGRGLAAAVGRVCGENMDTGHKKAMRELIIADKESYSEDEVDSILEYGAQDVIYLRQLFEFFWDFYRDKVVLKEDCLMEIMANHGEFMIEVALMEEEGIPLDEESVVNLSKNYVMAIEDVITKLVNEHGPFYVRAKADNGALVGHWRKPFDSVVNRIKEIGLYDTWPRTDKDTLKTDDQTMQDFGDGDPALRDFRQVKKTVDQLKWFRPDGFSAIWDNVGSDGRLRVFLNPYGTQTSRNAPKPSHGFIPAMANWLRCLMMPPEGYVIVGTDYSSQEFAIAAVMSGDEQMKEAYRSGDPYAYFAMLSGAMSMDDLNWFQEQKNGFDTVKDFECSDLDRFKRLADIRGLYKATTLGLQYGLGAENLAIKLTADTGMKFTEEDAAELIQLHKDAYPEYWAWLYEIVEIYEDEGKLILEDGWCLLADNHNSLSVRNFPVQGMGAVIMREACKRAVRKGSKLLFTLHDAIYSIAPVSKLQEHTEYLNSSMIEAVEEYLGQELTIRLETDYHRHGEPWVEGKGRKIYNQLSKWLKPQKDWKELEDDFLKTMGVSLTGYTTPLQ